ncbi:MAG: hypothetical protein ACI97N_000611 [Cognaticolwellia sp.]|jgi:uncharacterized protein (DUF697 family)
MDNQKYEEKRRQSVDMVIRNHIMWSMGAGFIPVPIADLFAVAAVQLDMVRQMCKLYDIDFKETEGKALITTLTSSSLARLGSRALVKLIPGVGSYIGGVSLAILSGASTFALGEVFKRHFETGGTFLDFDPSRLTKYYQEKFEKGKSVAKDLKKKQENERQTVEEEIIEKEREEEPVDTMETVKKEEVVTSTPPKSDIITKMKELAELKDAGIISEEEFAALKAKLIGEF